MDLSVCIQPTDSLARLAASIQRQIRNWNAPSQNLFGWKVNSFCQNVTRWHHILDVGWYGVVADCVQQHLGMEKRNNGPPCGLTGQTESCIQLAISSSHTCDLPTILNIPQKTLVQGIPHKNLDWRWLGKKLAVTGHIRRGVYRSLWGAISSLQPIFSHPLFPHLLWRILKKGFSGRGRLSFIDHSDTPGIKIGGRKWMDRPVWMGLLGGSPFMWNCHISDLIRWTIWKLLVLLRG